MARVCAVEVCQSALGQPVSGGTILNLGCGTKTSAHPSVVNIDWSIYLRLRRNPVLRACAPLVLRGPRLERFRRVSDNVRVHDLSRGIPFGDSSVDVVYHSHVLEHLDRPVAQAFQREVLRVLRPGGIQRIVVPDLEHLCRNYLTHLAAARSDPRRDRGHDAFVAELLEQSVRREAHGTSLQRPLRRKLENWILGDARRRGETHQWMYDEINLRDLVTSAGFREARRMSFNRSLIPDWERTALDRNDDGGEYKPFSLYLEAVK
jgi:SAM-dependent methyltransferase